MNDTAIKPNTSIDLERLATIGRQVIAARAAKAEEENRRLREERVAELQQKWEPYIQHILAAIAEWLPTEDLDFDDLSVVGPGWFISMPNDYPYRGGNYLPVTLVVHGCMPIKCFSNGNDGLIFEAGAPELLFDDEENRWFVRESFGRWCRHSPNFGEDNGDLTVAIAQAVDSHVKMQELREEANRRNQSLASSSPPAPAHPEVVDYLKEAKRAEEMLSKINGPSAELFQSGILAALIAIGEELRIRHY